MCKQKTTMLATFLSLLLSAAIGCSCSNSSKTANDGSNNITREDTLRLGNFNADSAYSYIAEQVAFGPRVPGTPEHDACRDWLVNKLKQLGIDSVFVQNATVTASNGDVLPISNIIGGIYTNHPKRIVIAAHWDTRPWADQETSADKRALPILGANDGGSGVAVILELVRNLAQVRPNVGVDFILFDAEDYGDSGGFNTNDQSWCLGSQYWSRNVVPYRADNLPEYGIVLDMVGGRNAKFNYEAYSAENAPTPTIKVWSEAERLGYGNIFDRTIGGVIVDDHVSMNRAGIPTTDVIELNNHETGSFPPTWHTLEDNLDNIDKNTLRAVGETILNVIYKEKSFKKNDY